MKQSFKILWKNKGRNSLIMIEMGISFLVLFALTTLIVHNVNNYVKPLGFNYHDVWRLEIDFSGMRDSTNQNRDLMALVKNQLKSFNEIDNITMTASNVPYTTGTYMTSLYYNSKPSSNTYAYFVDDSFAGLLHIKVSEGRWFNATDDAAERIPIVVNRKLISDLFNDESPVGKTVHSGKYKVVGIVDHYRHKGEFSKEMPGYFVRLQPNDIEGELLIKVKPGTGAAFEAEMMNKITSMAPGWTINLNKLEDLRNRTLKRILIPIIIFGLITGFLIINVVLGIFGVLWHNISLRKEEIGVRRAVGSTGRGIYTQLIGEMLILATLGMIPALIIAAQFPILNVFNVESHIYLLAIALSAVLIYLLVGLSAVLPGKQATKIQPAIALHEE